MQCGTPTGPGTPVHLNFRKWDGAEHWQFDATYLGSDEHGAWLGIPAGAHFARPGRQFDGECAQVTLITREGWAPVFHDQHDPERVRVYVDITTIAAWAVHDGGHVVTLIDMDLDVVQLANGCTFVDDEDEFAQHRMLYGYPVAEVARCEADCARVLDMIREHAAPFDGTADRWMRRFLSRR